MLTTKYEHCALHQPSLSAQRMIAPFTAPLQNSVKKILKMFSGNFFFICLIFVFNELDLWLGITVSTVSFKVHIRQSTTSNL